MIPRCENEVAEVSSLCQSFECVFIGLSTLLWSFFLSLALHYIMALWFVYMSEFPLRLNEVILHPCDWCRCWHICSILDASVRLLKKLAFLLYCGKIYYIILKYDVCLLVMRIIRFYFKWKYNVIHLLITSEVSKRNIYKAQMQSWEQ